MPVLLRLVLGLVAFKCGQALDVVLWGAGPQSCSVRVLGPQSPKCSVGGRPSEFSVPGLGPAVQLLRVVDYGSVSRAVHLRVSSEP